MRDDRRGYLAQDENRLSSVSVRAVSALARVDAVATPIQAESQRNGNAKRPSAEHVGQPVLANEDPIHADRERQPNPQCSRLETR